MYRREAPFVPGTRWGGARNASTVWRQVATARGWNPNRRLPSRCHATVAARTLSFAWTDRESDH